MVVDSTMFGNPEDMLLENEDEDLTSEEEQSDNDDCDVDDGDKNDYEKDNFILKNKNEWFVVSTLLLMKTITNLLICLKLRKKRWL